MPRLRLPKDLVFLPLGGSGEIGMNMNLYGYGGKWLMVDLGITFAESTLPGIDVITPDPAFIEAHRDDLVGLVVTHAHEDHLGAIPYLWPRLRCPVYATGFAASLLQRKLVDVGLNGVVPIHIVPESGRVSLPPFDIEYIYITHSIPEPYALAIRTPAGTVMHTGDWKLDPAPMLGPVTDEESLRRVGGEGVLALVGDSTNAIVDGRSGSEADVRETLTRLIGKYRTRVVVTCFASNVARLESIAHAAKANGRVAALVGRSLLRMDEIARENGYLRGLPPFLTEVEAAQVPPENLVLICTGSQGEPRAALSRIATDNHPHIGLDEGDVVLFSSRAIPGNERAIGKVQNELSRLGVEIVTDRDEAIHVSGHPAREELVQMYQWIRPHIAVPVHGEERHMRAHAALAETCQVPHAIVPRNGQVIRLGQDGPEVIAEVPAGRLALDGEVLVPVDGSVVKGRTRMLWNGAVLATIVLDRRGRLVDEPQVSAPGLVDGTKEDELLAEIVDEIDDAIAGLGRTTDDDAVRQAVQRAVRRVVQARRSKKPVTEVHLVRLRG